MVINFASIGINGFSHNYENTLLGVKLDAYWQCGCISALRTWSDRWLFGVGDVLRENESSWFFTNGTERQSDGRARCAMLPAGELSCRCAYVDVYSDDFLSIDWIKPTWERLPVMIIIRLNKHSYYSSWIWSKCTLFIGTIYFITGWTDSVSPGDFIGLSIPLILSQYCSLLIVSPCYVCSCRASRCH